MKTRVYLVEEAGEYILREYPINSRPSNFVATPPPGFRPGDEANLKWNPETRVLDVNFPKKIKGQKKEKRMVRKKISDEKWNNRSPYQRFLSRIFKRYE